MLKYGRWYLEIGDPTFIGWFTFTAYFLTGLLCLATHKAQITNANKLEGANNTWLVISLLFIFLAINKQLDLHRLITEVGRNIANSQGWYEHRRLIQTFFITSLLFGALLSGALSAKIIKRLGKPEKYAFIGICLIFLYVLVRAMSFHHFNILIPAKLTSSSMLWIIELSGIIIVFIASIFSIKNQIIFKASHLSIECNEKHETLRKNTQQIIE